MYLLKIWCKSLNGFKSNGHSKFSGGKQNDRLSEHVYSNQLINPDYGTADQLAAKYGVLKTTFCLDNLYLLHTELVIIMKMQAMGRYGNVENLIAGHEINNKDNRVV